MAFSRKVRVSAGFAVLTGLILRLFFILKFPVQDSGDAPFYIELARNWLKNGVYGVPIAGHLTPVDMRLPGYPAFLAALFAVFGQSTRPILVAQALVDLATCVLVALIAARLASPESRQRVALAALWLAAVCPFTANYTAVVLTESLVIFFSALALLVFLEACTGADAPQPPGLSPWFLGGLIVGFGTLARPETPLLLLAAGFALVASSGRLSGWENRSKKIARAVALMTAGLVLPLLPWAARNWSEFHEVQFLAPHYSTLPGEFAPLGFDAWINTWLWRFRDVYLVTWKLDVEAISVNDLPPSAFDSTGQKSRLAEIFAKYSETLAWGPDQDRELGEIAKERTARNPLRTFVKVPVLRSLGLWFTPRVELLPVSGNLWPPRIEWLEDRRDFVTTLTLVLVNGIYLALALAGAWISRRRAPWAGTLLLAFIVVRTIYFGGLADEAPEPRYVLECFPAILALGAQVFQRRSQLSSIGSG
jgi:hypothetical protein